MGDASDLTETLGRHLLLRVEKLEELLGPFIAGTADKVSRDDSYHFECGYCGMSSSTPSKDHWRRCTLHPLRKAGALSNFIRWQKYKADEDLVKIVTDLAVRYSRNARVLQAVRNNVAQKEEEEGDGEG